MVDPKGRSERRFSGKSGKPLKNFTLFLDESFDYTEVKQELVKANIKHRVYTEFFTRGEEDCDMLPLVGRRGWAMLTCDKRNRRRGLERKAILLHNVRQFVFQGNLGGIYMGNLLVKTYPRLREFARRNQRPFVAIVTKAGNINLRMDKDGNLHGRELGATD
jgi:hypothetical protein